MALDGKIHEVVESRLRAVGFDLTGQREPPDHLSDLDSEKMGRMNRIGTVQ